MKEHIRRLVRFAIIEIMTNFYMFLSLCGIFSSEISKTEFKQNG